MNSPQFYSFIENPFLVRRPCSAAFPRFVHKLQQKTDASGCTAVERPFDLLCWGKGLDPVSRFRVFAVFPDGLCRDAILGLHFGQQGAGFLQPFRTQQLGHGAERLGEVCDGQILADAFQGVRRAERCFDVVLCKRLAEIVIARVVRKFLQEPLDQIRTVKPPDHILVIPAHFVVSFAQCHIAPFPADVKSRLFYTHLCKKSRNSTPPPGKREHPLQPNYLLQFLPREGDAKGS